MDRLTYVTEDGTVLFSPDGEDSVTIKDISLMGDIEYLEKIADTLANREFAAMFYERKYNDVCKELKAYEDTGLTPEEIMDGKMLTGWILVEERLPEEQEDVLIQWEVSRRHDNIVEIHLDKGRICCSDRVYWLCDWGVPDGKVVAWMPLPEPYKED